MWSEAHANGTRMGRYLTSIEWTFIEQAFSLFGWPKVVLDIGGGDGRFAKSLAKQGVRVINLEYDSLPLYIMKDESKQILLVHGDGNCLPFDVNSFDSIITIEVLACLDRYHCCNFLGGIARILRKKGIFLFTTDNYLSLMGMFKLRRPLRYKHGSYESYSESFFTTKKNIINAGFDILSVRGFRWLPFGRTSENPLLPYAARLEKFFGLHRIPWFSPWIFWVIRKREVIEKRFTLGLRDMGTE
jgi:SAM-dependent methyltransferase